MKKLIIATLLSLFTIGAYAINSTPPVHTPKVHHVEKHIKNEQRDIKADQAKLAQDLKSGNKKAARADKRNIRKDRRAIKRAARRAKKLGVKHPVKKADGK